MSDPLVVLKDVTAYYFNQAILQHCSFMVHKGQHWALLGSSNSGHRALLEVLAGKLQVRQGETFYFPFAAANHTADSGSTPGNSRMAYVSSRHNFCNLSHTADFYYQQRYNATEAEEAPTVQDYLSAISTHAPEHCWTLDKVVQLFALQPHLQKHLIQLSNGETRRLLLAAALLKNPALLLLDHPLTGLDVASRAAFDHLLQQIAASGITLVLITTPEELPSAITHVALFEKGKLVHQVERNHFKPSPKAAAETETLDQQVLRALLYVQQPAQHHVIIDMQNVFIRYGNKTILNNINWQVRRGEKWALLGPNGAGKSTLLSLVNGDNPQAYANNITLFDRKRGSGESIWDIKKKTGFVSPELFQYFPGDQSCLQVIESGMYDTLGLFKPSHPQLAAKAQHWMRLFSILPHAHHLFRQVPVSTQRLCLLARALIKNPPLLLLDEPGQDLDHEQQQYMKQVVETICAHNNTTLIYVSHYKEQIPGCITHTLRLENGKVLQTFDGRLQ